MCWIFLETLPIWLPIRCPFKKIVYASWKVLKICLRVSKRWLWSFRKSVRHFPREQLLHDVTTVLKFRDIERFHSRDQHLCKFMGTKESVYIREEINSHRIDLEHQHGCRFIVLGHQYGRREVMWKRSIPDCIERFHMTSRPPYWCSKRTELW